ncbi:acyl-CoA thioesterase [Belliella sp. DSM 111904]|uniref:Acyl-CoA thioesterase n=1 Tax=Belliella filtrata TaxID=2923435 RepID=A0ABS9UXG0_9BACT|nr:acyl-CoA thioesterase [Belliella filtrata]MCH7408866.1 acyl-CoA thioesterase [Belliella filtrata]
MTNYKWEDLNSSFSFSEDIQIRFSDIDGYMHVNNGIYFNYLEHARAMYLHKTCQWDAMKFGTVVANVNIDYKTPIHFGDEVKAFVKCVKIGSSSFVLEQVLGGTSSDGKHKVYAVAQVTMVSVDLKTMKPVAVPESYAAKMQNDNV